MKALSSRAGVHKKGTVNLNDVIEATKENEEFQKAGAVALFVGVVKAQNKEKQRVERLKIQAYNDKADAVLENICERLREKEGIIDVRIHHLLGDFKVGEELVYVIVAGIHREQVFPVLKEAVEKFKKEAPIFKKEYIVDDNGIEKSYWIGEQK